MKKLYTYLSAKLDGVTMYLLLVAGLSIITLITIILSLIGLLHIPALGIIISLVISVAVGFIANRYFAKLFKVDTNRESWLISMLIIVLIFPPVSSVHSATLISLVALVTIASKFTLVYCHKHIFNPVAIAAVILGLSGLIPPIWWIGSPVLFIPVLIFGLAVIRKLRKYSLFVSFFIAALATSLIVGLINHQIIGTIISTLLFSGPIIFLGTVMLTEPQTTPDMTWKMRIYGIVVGILFACQFNLGILSATPELALIIGNIFAFIVAPKFKERLILKSNNKLSSHIYEFTFGSSRPIRFKPGQYLEWTLEHPKSDIRGTRRTFSISSIPNQHEVSFVIKTNEKSSSFKKELLDLKYGDSITAGHLSGGFTLPKKSANEIVLIAGGIGITPFLSMVRTIVQNNQQREDIIIFYLLSNEDEYCFQDVWIRAEGLGVKVLPIITSVSQDSTWKGLTDRLTPEILKNNIKDVARATYFLSGPPSFVKAYKSLLSNEGVSRSSQKTDYFSGY